MQSGADGLGSAYATNLRGLKQSSWFICMDRDRAVKQPKAISVIIQHFYVSFEREIPHVRPEGNQYLWIYRLYNRFIKFRLESRAGFLAAGTCVLNTGGKRRLATRQTPR